MRSTPTGTSDPKAALGGVVLPIGTYKGSGLSMLMDIFGGVISGANYGGDVGDQYKVYDRPQDVGHFFLAMKPDLFVPEENYRHRMDTLIERVHAARPPKASTRFSRPASRSDVTKKNAAGAGFPTAPTRPRRCRRKPPTPALRRSTCRRTRLAAEHGGYPKLTCVTRGLDHASRILSDLRT